MELESKKVFVNLSFEEFKVVESQNMQPGWELIFQEIIEINELTKIMENEMTKKEINFLKNCNF